MKNSLFVFDTNTLISAVLISSSISRKALNIAFKRGTLVFSEETISELNTVLIRSKFDKYISLSDRLDFIQLIENRALIKITTSNFTDCRDKKDNKFLNLAFDSQSKCIITGDKDLIVLNPFKEIRILSSTDFLSQYS
jgi:putative PIN family toxin of toxin-antitoxin system